MGVYVCVSVKSHLTYGASVFSHTAWPGITPRVYTLVLFIMHVFVTACMDSIVVYWTYTYMCTLDIAIDFAHAS